MDVSAFSEDDYDVKDWINRTFKSTEAQGDKDAFVSSLLIKLQLYVQQVNGSLEETSQSVLSSLPRILRDTLLLQQEAVSLKEKMATVKQEIAKVDKDTSSSLVALEKIDRIKTSLQLAKQSLHEADNWSVLANDIEELFESDDVENIAVKIFSMQKSLSMLVNAADYEDKKLQLEGLKNRLEALTSPKLVHAFTARNSESSKLYVNIFEKMNRLPQLLKYYHNCLKVSLCQEWRKLTEIAQDENIIYWLHKFYDKLLSEWHDQVKWCNSVFPTPSTETLLDIYTDLLQSLEPSIPDSISTFLNQHSNTLQLSLLLELKQTTRHFAVSLTNTSELSSKLSPNPPNDKFLLLIKVIYQPYVIYIKKYSTYETAQLLQQLGTIPTDQDDLSDTINSLGLSISRVIDYANDANKRCKLFTDGCGYPGLVKSLSSYFKQYLEKYKMCIKKFDKRKTRHEDWSLFQMCLTLFQIIGDVLVQVEEFEVNLVGSILETTNKLQDNNEEIINRHRVLLLDDEGRRELDDLLNLIKQDDKKILEQIIKLVHCLCTDLHRTTYEVIFAPIYTQLMSVKNAPAWSNDAEQLPSFNVDLPDYSFAPQEYITQVGQYLMTLPQHLEPFLLRDNPSLMHALRAADEQYSKGSTESGFTDTLLGIIAKGTCQMFQDQTIGNICQINAAGCKQLATDIDYLGNVLEELGLALSENLQQMSTLLRLPADDYHGGTSGCNPRIVAAVRQMRNIASSG